MRGLEPRGAVAVDGRIKPGEMGAGDGGYNVMTSGDLLLAVNTESLWRVTSSVAREVLARADTGGELVQ